MGEGTVVGQRKLKSPLVGGGGVREGRLANPGRKVSLKEVALYPPCLIPQSLGLPFAREAGPSISGGRGALRGH